MDVLFVLGVCRDCFVMKNDDLSKEEQAAMEAAQLRSAEPPLRDILKREHDENQKRPRNVALEKRWPSFSDILWESFRPVKFDNGAKPQPKAPVPAKKPRRDGPEMDR